MIKTTYEVVFKNKINFWKRRTCRFSLSKPYRNSVGSENSLRSLAGADLAPERQPNVCKLATQPGKDAFCCVSRSLLPAEGFRNHSVVLTRVTLSYVAREVSENVPQRRYYSLLQTGHRSNGRTFWTTGRSIPPFDPLRLASLPDWRTFDEPLERGGTTSLANWMTLRNEGFRRVGHFSSHGSSEHWSRVFPQHQAWVPQA